MEIACLSVSHKRAKVETIEKAWIGVDNLVKILKSLPLKESAFIFTCNRFEVYAVAEDATSYLKELSNKLGIENYAEILHGEKCIRHLLRLASGLESMVVGEDQILGQIRDYFNLCKKFCLTGEILNKVFGKAINVGVRVRKETNISRGSLSIGSVAIELAENTLGTLDGRTILIIGAGEMGTLVAKSIANRNIRKILIANRTFSRAQELAKEIGGIAVKFDKISEYLPTADVVISATAAPHIILTKKIVEATLKDRKESLLIIDLGLPRNVEESVGELEKVVLYTIDDLRSVSEENFKKRIKEVEFAEKIVEEELEHLKVIIKELSIKTAVASMYRLASKYFDEEVEELFAKLSAKYKLEEQDKKMFYDFANSLIKKFLYIPTLKLKEAAKNGNPHLADVVQYLFCEDQFESEKASEKWHNLNKLLSQ
ncbi:MAG: glutamyl-tRNA reductase [Archaeoglobales archaeon]|nr:glutamyl-tRNA reductase [Archaeoglobales archaeon]